MLLSIESDPIEHPVSVLTATEHSNVGATPKTIERALFYLLGDQLKAAVRKAVQEIEYPACDAETQGRN